jgi:putative hydrolase of the HAD superfamily
LPNDVPRRTAIIFDLDNCLAAADEVGQQLLEPVFAAVRAANDGTLSSDAIDAAFRDCWVHSFDWVAERHHFTERMHAAGWSALQEIEVCDPMRGYGDLALLPQLGDVRFLVTSGFRRLQESKVRALGVASHFEAVVIDAVDEPDRRGKERIFLDLIERHGLMRDEVLVVGDNAESELAAAERLGLRRVQTLRPGVPRAANVTAYVHGLAELQTWLRG